MKKKLIALFAMHLLSAAAFVTLNVINWFTYGSFLLVFGPLAIAIVSTFIISMISVGAYAFMSHKTKIEIF